MTRGPIGFRARFRVIEFFNACGAGQRTWDLCVFVRSDSDYFPPNGDEFSFFEPTIFSHPSLRLRFKVESAKTDSYTASTPTAHFFQENV